MARTPLFKHLARAIRSSANPTGDNILHPRLNRRSFLQAMGLGAVALSLPVHGREKVGLNPEVVVLGGGIAGLGAAYQLQKFGVSAKVYEAASRLGGRILTLNNFNGDGQFVELGGELIDHKHEAMWSVARDLGIEIEDLRQDPLESVGEAFFCGGQFYSFQDFEKAVVPFVRHVQRAGRELRRGLNDEATLGYWLRRHPGVRKYDFMSIAEFLDGMKDVEEWVKAAIRTAYTCEYGLEVGEQTSINLIDFIDQDLSDGFGMFGESDEGFRIRGGNSRLIEGLIAATFTENPGAPEVHLDHELQWIGEQGGKLALSFRQGSATRTVYADYVICALPFSRLRHVEGLDKLDISREKMRSIHEMGYGTNSKIMLSFKNRFWRSGQSRPANKGSLYTDLAAQSFWETSRMQMGERGVLTNFLGGQVGRDASLREARRSVEVLAAIFADKNLQDYAEVRDGGALWAVTSNWSKWAYQSGSYTCLKPGQVTRFWGQNHMSELKDRLLFAGEHTSLSDSGFMNGGLESGLRAAKQLVRKLKNRKVG